MPDRSLHPESLPLLRFIPFRRDDIVSMCLERQKLNESEAERFRDAADTVRRVFRDEFSELRLRLKHVYAPLDPDADTRTVELGAAEEDAGEVGQLLQQLLRRANYDEVTPEALDRALQAASLFDIKLHVAMEEFEEVILYTRGANLRNEQVPRFMGLFPRRVEFVNYDRVVLYLRFKSAKETPDAGAACRPGATMLKLFQNVPDADLEMLFPNTRVGMRLIDKLLIGVPALISGGIVLTTKLGTTLVLLGSLVGFWLGMRSESVELNRASVLALLAGLGALGGYLWKQFSSFRNRKLQFTQALTESLYFKLLDNNAGVLFRLLDDAEDSECKESLLAFYFLLEAGSPQDADELDLAIETWLAERWQCRLDFEIDDALGKLDRLGLAHCEAGKWQLVAN